MITLDKIYKPFRDGIVVENIAPPMTDSGIELVKEFRDKASGQIVKSEDGEDEVYKVLAVGKLAEIEGIELGMLILISGRTYPAVCLVKDKGQFQIRLHEVMGFVEPNYKEAKIKVEAPKLTDETKDFLTKAGSTFPMAGKFKGGSAKEILAVNKEGNVVNINKDSNKIDLDGK